MFDLSFAEIVVVAVIAIMVIGPKELPTLLRTIGGWIGKARRFTGDVTRYLESLDSNGDVDALRSELQESARFIKGDDGKIYESFDISDVIDSSKSEVAHSKEEIKSHD